MRIDTRQGCNNSRSDDLTSAAHGRGSGQFQKKSSVVLPYNNKLALQKAFFIADLHAIQCEALNRTDVKAGIKAALEQY